LSTGTGLYGACRSTQCCLAVWTRWLESSTRLGGFRALKKTPEAPYTTKVNYRDHTSRGTTLVHSVSALYCVLYRVRFMACAQGEAPSKYASPCSTSLAARGEAPAAKARAAAGSRARPCVSVRRGLAASRTRPSLCVWVPKLPRRRPPLRARGAEGKMDEFWRDSGGGWGKAGGAVAEVARRGRTVTSG
jgi:hypothetical protein